MKITAKNILSSIVLSVVACTFVACGGGSGDVGEGGSYATVDLAGKTLSFENGLLFTFPTAEGGNGVTGMTENGATAAAFANGTYTYEARGNYKAYLEVNGKFHRESKGDGDISYKGTITFVEGSSPAAGSYSYTKTEDGRTSDQKTVSFSLN